MARTRSILVGVWDFVVGDDWQVAIGVVLAVAVTAVLADSAVTSWWVLPVAVVLLLGWSIRRSARS